MFLSVIRFWGPFSANNSIGNNRFVPKVRLTQQFDHEAIVTQAIAPHQIGQVRYQASWWRARCELDVTLQEGEIVRVIGCCANNSTLLLVEPLPRVNFS